MNIVGISWITYWIDIICLGIVILIGLTGVYLLALPILIYYICRMIAQSERTWVSQEKSSSR